MDNSLIILILFVFGTLFGSFLNVLIDRFSTERSVVKGRSYCEHCKKILTWTELIPLVSYIKLKGRCRHCKSKIPVRLFIVELSIGVLFLLLYFYGQTQQIGLIPLILIGIVIYSFIGIFFADIQYGIIPDKLVIVSAVATIFFLFSNHTPLLPHVLSAFGAFLFFFALFAFTKGRGMGFGDVKLSFVIGLFLGLPLTLLALYLAFLTGAIISIILVLCKKVSFRKGTIPFGPFLVLSTILCFFYGEKFLLPLIFKYI